jgi:predicted nucleic acid-binding protein
MRAQLSTILFTTAVTEAEIFYGLRIMPPGRRRAALEQMVIAIFEQFADRILPFDSTAAGAYADILSVRRKLGRPLGQSDAQIAAIARSRGAALATRNIDDFVGCGVVLINPWKE